MLLKQPSNPGNRGSCRVSTTGLVLPRKATSRGEGLITHGGLARLGAVPDRVGPSAGLEAATTELESRPKRHITGDVLC